jgi:NADH-quinone oxidoreductase subunit M
MGFVLLGIFSLTHAGIMGGSMQQINHGISTGALFLLVGLLYERRHTRLFSEFGGLKAQMPIYAAIFLIVMLSSVGLPGTNGFVGEFLAMMGAFEACYFRQFGLNLTFAYIAGTGVILAAVYLLWMFQKTFLGRVTNPINARLKDIKPWEIALCTPIVVLIFWGGFFPNTFLKPMEASVMATRMMALNPPDQRPVWSDLNMEVDGHGDLRKVLSPRTQQSIAEAEPQFGETIAKVKVHFGPEDVPEEKGANAPSESSALHVERNTDRYVGFENRPPTYPNYGSPGTVYGSPPYAMAKRAGGTP